ncbi:hypothetical protein COCMIDRAFT_36583 [Bipolaris oryzae ATCC 44560]|uniref:WSC domain-containing protein n=1 Tax=Bipolaris oryzae ATCC 44560 TaxID=930090 RepID=W6ZPZ1_COCMI|nr:uncharacterized protein COCMIDRAFT_36583 [Bipolaris oryzae ATCC 44560]EUC45686.1 hypothetical protein COCMIDRAFT_36583 [Bipolaris oryzae ATCC 44560]
MRTSLALLFTALAQRAVSTRTPLLQWDPDTVYDFTPAEFHEWNPSVGLDCKPWRFQSYCTITQRKLDAWKPKTTSSQVTTTTTSTTSSSSSSSSAPSPTAWNALGCYAQYPTHPLLEQNLNADGDAALTVAKCKDSCYRRVFTYAGVQGGNQCWCSSFVGGEWTENQSDCNVPCTGNEAEMCGGKGVFDVFEAVQEDVLAAATTATSTTTERKSVETVSTSFKTATTSNSAVSSGAVSNGAIRNMPLFGMRF